MSGHSYVYPKKDVYIIEDNHLALIEDMLNLFSEENKSFEIKFENHRLLKLNTLAGMDQETLVKNAFICGIKAESSFYVDKEFNHIVVSIDTTIPPGWLYVSANSDESRIDRLQAKTEALYNSCRPWYHSIHANGGAQILFYISIIVLTMFSTYLAFNNLAAGQLSTTSTIIMAGISATVGNLIVPYALLLFPGFSVNVGASKKRNERYAASRRWIGLFSLTIILGMVVRWVVLGRP